MPSLDIFISHSSQDTDIARSVIDLLRTALTIPPERIRCTSVEGYKLKAGASTDETLRREVHDSTVLIGIITEASLNSAYVLFELGARWGASLSMAPLLARGVTAQVLRGPLTGINALRADNTGDIHQLIDNVAEELKLPRPSASVYQNQLETLLERAKIVLTKSGEESQPDAAELPRRDKQLLSDEEQELLVAAEGKGGALSIFSVDQGKWICIGNRNFYDDSDASVAALYLNQNLQHWDTHAAFNFCASSSSATAVPTSGM